jgi:hypothetical protein
VAGGSTHSWVPRHAGNKDLDLLVRRADLPRYREITTRAGFRRKLVWEESRAVMVDGAKYDCAFVDAHADGREIDVHLADIDDDGAVTQFHDGPWPLPVDALSGTGTLAGRELRCVSRSGQLAMHSALSLQTTTAKTCGSCRTSPEGISDLAAPTSTSCPAPSMDRWPPVLLRTEESAAAVRPARGSVTDVPCSRVDSRASVVVRLRLTRVGSNDVERGIVE